jgi:hypothetical protein
MSFETRYTSPKNENLLNCVFLDTIKLDSVVKLPQGKYEIRYGNALRAVKTPTPEEVRIATMYLFNLRNSHFLHDIIANNSSILPPSFTSQAAVVVYYKRLVSEFRDDHYSYSLPKNSV